MFSGLVLNATEYPLPFHFVSPIVLAPTELALTYLDGLVRTADFLRAAQHIVQHELPTQFDPISDGSRTELMLLLESVSRNAANDVREEQKLHAVEFTLLKPCTMPD